MADGLQRKPALRSALAFLRGCLAEHPAGTRLPGLPSLASAAGVSHVTMMRAVHLLRDEDLCTVVAGQGITVGTMPKKHVAPRAHPRRKWEELKVELERDIVLGSYQPGRSLPPLKELEDRYGVSYLTLSRALSALVREGVLSTYSGTYRLPHLTTGRQRASRAGRTAPRATVVLILGGSEAGVVATDDPSFADFLYWLERESFVADFRLSTIPYDDSRGPGVFHTPDGPTAALTDQDWVLGYLVFYSRIGDIGRLCQHILSLGKPVSLVNTGGSLPPTLVGRMLRMFHIAYTEKPGRDVAEYLLRLGHRHVAYISPYHRSPWSHNRLRGLQRSFASAGLPSGVVPFVREEYHHNDDYLQQVVQRSDPEAGIPVPSLLRDMPAILHSHVDSLRQACRELYRDREILNYCVPLFGDALSDRRLSAWVCSIDYIALFALSFILRQGLRVPRDISLIGFDDLPDSRARALSTYRFDTPTLAHNAVAHVLSPSYGPLVRGGSSCEIGGMVVERSTTGPARTTPRSPAQ